MKFLFILPVVFFGMNVLANDMLGFSQNKFENFKKLTEHDSKSLLVEACVDFSGQWSGYCKMRLGANPQVAELTIIQRGCSLFANPKNQTQVTYLDSVQSISNATPYITNNISSVHTANGVRTYAWTSDGKKLSELALLLDKFVGGSNGVLQQMLTSTFQIENKNLVINSKLITTTIHNDIVKTEEETHICTFNKK